MPSSQALPLFTQGLGITILSLVRPKGICVPVMWFMVRCVQF